MKNRFFIIVTGWNCAAKVERCWQSIKAQTYKNHYSFFCDDGSTDGTGERVWSIREMDWTMGASLAKKNEGAAANRDYILRNHCLDKQLKSDIILFLGMDDELLPNALERINQEYEQGKLMTYGNWINQDGVGLPSNFDLEFPDKVHRDRSYRRVRYRSTAPNTFRRFLYDCIKPEDLQINGEWYKATTESEVMFSCLEQCGKDRIGVIKEPIYLYNQNREDNARHRFGVQYQEMIYNRVINKPIRPLWSGS